MSQEFNRVRILVWKLAIGVSRGGGGGGGGGGSVVEMACMFLLFQSTRMDSGG